MSNRISIKTTVGNMHKDALKVYNFWQLGRKEKEVPVKESGVDNSAENNTEKPENNHSDSLDSIE